jgi:hypothetical protein
MTTMPEIMYIGGSHNNDYMATSAGTDPYVQNLNEGDTIQDVVMSSNIGLAENTTPKVMSASDGSVHQYMVPDGERLIPYVVNSNPVVADEMPKHLIGWRAKHNQNNTYDDFNYHTLTAQVVTDYSSSNNEITLYGKWEDVSLIRVIVFIPFSSGSQGVRCRYNTEITANRSYVVDPSDSYPHLSQNYKEIVDYENPEDKQAIDYSATGEYGSGNGCPKIVSSALYPTYFAIKTDDRAILTITQDQGNFIPTFEMVPDPRPDGDYIPLYHYYKTSALRCNVNGCDKNSESGDFTFNNSNNTNRWTTQVFTNESDTTIMVPLVMKPTLTVGVLPQGVDGYYAYIGTQLTPPQSQTQTGYYMPNDTCSVYTRTSVSSATFDGWYIDGPGGGFASSNNPYSFKIVRNTHIVAKWTLPTPPAQPPYVEVSYLLVDGNDTSIINGSYTVQYSIDGGTNWTNLTNTNVVTPTLTGNSIKLRAPQTGNGNLGNRYIFGGFRQYFGNLRIPTHDMDLSTGNFAQGGSYEVEGFTSPYNGYRLNLTGLANGSSYKVYAFYMKEYI